MDDDKLEYRLTASDEGLKIREILRRRLGLSTRLIRKLKSGGGVTLNGALVRLNAKAAAGDAVTVSFPRELSRFEPEDIAFGLIYEDSDLLIIDKPAGLVVHPTKGHSDHTVANGVMRHMLDRGEEYRIRFINRLDMDTTGLLVIGKNAYSHRDFNLQSSEKTVMKRYTAVVEGLVEDREGRIDLPIGQADSGQIRRSVIDCGLPSATRFRVLEHLGGRSLLDISLETGRTHQIRVHMAHIGHPVVGDSLYGNPAPSLIGRQALHASELSFRHPRARTGMSVRAPLPEDMETLIDRLRGSPQF